MSFDIESMNRFFRYKDIYTSDLREMGGDVSRFEELLDLLSNKSQKALLSHTVAYMDTLAYTESLKQKKIDPYIAAGAGGAIGKSIGGYTGSVIGSIEAGISAQTRNERIDYNREIGRKESYESVKKTASIDAECEKIVAELKKITKKCKKAEKIIQCNVLIELYSKSVKNDKSELQLGWFCFSIGIIATIVGMVCLVTETPIVSLFVIPGIPVIVYSLKRIFSVNSALDIHENELEKMYLSLEEANKMNYHDTNNRRKKINDDQLEQIKMSYNFVAKYDVLSNDQFILNIYYALYAANSRLLSKINIEEDNIYAENIKCIIENRDKILKAVKKGLLILFDDIVATQEYENIKEWCGKQIL